MKSRTIIGTVFLQREQCFKKYNQIRCPRLYFINDLSQFIRNIIAEGNKVMLTVDINEHVTDRKLPVELRKVGIAEVFVKKFNSLGPMSHVTGSKLIDGI